MLAGCGASQPPIGAPGAIPQSRAINNTIAAHQKTFHYTGGKQSFTVPARVQSITVVARGAAGYSGCLGPLWALGRGGRISAAIPVIPHQRLLVYVGGKPQGSKGGFNGGGQYGGGGASDVRVSPGGLGNRIIVAGGGGGQGGGGDIGKDMQFGCGGAGGGLIGGNGGQGLDYGSDTAGAGGSGGTQSAGGAGGSGGAGSGSTCQEPGSAGDNGKRGVGGAGAYVASYSNGRGGGGGGGYFGGGGGGSGCESEYVSNGGGGGGGGSSYAEPSAKKVHIWQNWKGARSDGLVVFSW